MKRYIACAYRRPERILWHKLQKIGKRMHSVETKDEAATEFLNSSYVLDQWCWGVKYDIWDSGPNGSGTLHFVCSPKQQNEKQRLIYFYFHWLWKSIWSSCLVFTPMNSRIHGLFQIIYFMLCSLESVCVCVCRRRRSSLQLLRGRQSQRDLLSGTESRCHWQGLFAFCPNQRTCVNGEEVNIHKHFLPAIQEDGTLNL